jgi:flagellar P-ring protein precursor FlgI
VERVVTSPFTLGDKVTLELSATDFGTAQRVAEAINGKYGAGTANPVDGRVIEVRAPVAPSERVAFVSELEGLQVKVESAPAKVIVNARTGSIVMNGAVSLEPCAVAHGNLTVSISTETAVSQPNALGAGQTVVTHKSDIKIKQDNAALMVVPSGAKLADVVKALNALGASPQDLLAILQGMKASGALRAELEVI